MNTSAGTRSPRFRISFRIKLLLVASSLLIIPWIGTEYIQEMESYLRQQQEDALLTRTSMIATVMQTHPDLFKTGNHEILPTRNIRHIFVRPLHSPIQLDGYLDDWTPYAERMQSFTIDNAIKGSEDSVLHFEHQLGTYKHNLYAVFRIHDPQIVYRDPDSLQLHKSDHLRIVMEDAQGQLQRYIVTTIAPGWVSAYKVSSDRDDPQPLRPETRIKGEWQETADGYNIEIRIPTYMLGKRLSFAVADVNDRQSRYTDTLIATAGLEYPATLGTLMFPSQQAETLLKPLQLAQTRTWVIDKQNRVLARTGSLHTRSEETDDPPQYSFITGLMSLLYKLILKQPASEFHDELLNASRLNSEEFKQALLGKPAIRWRQTPDKQVNILTATWPVIKNDEVIGAIAIEKTSNAILLAQNRAMEIMFNLSALAFVIACSVLLVFASRLISRVRKLRDATEEAITADGRVVKQLNYAHSRDELGDLSRSVADMLERLAQYNRYLESMASKLSHELRTPITVVRSSLDNLNDLEQSPDSRTYTERARQGIERLDNILTRMSEATRLEQTLQSEQQITFTLNEVVAGCVEGYRLAHVDIEFVMLLPETPLTIKGSPDLIAQMLDKLISNAIDFHRTGTPIRLELTAPSGVIMLTLSNQGPLLPEHMQHTLFESMVSVRDKKGDQPHLGIGLYIVRLIAEFHHAKVQAHNNSANDGVNFTVAFPASSS